MWLIPHAINVFGFRLRIVWFTWNFKNRTPWKYKFDILGFWSVLLYWTIFIDFSLYIYIYIYIYNHHVMPPARISLTLSRHFSLLFIASCRFSGLHPASSHSCCMYVQAGRPVLFGHMWGSIGDITYELVSVCPAESCRSGSSNLHSFCDRR